MFNNKNNHGGMEFIEKQEEFFIRLHELCATVVKIYS